MMFYDSTKFLAVKDYVKPEYFSDPVLADLASIMLDFYHRYKRPIELEELTQELDLLIDSAHRPIPRENYAEEFGELLQEGVDKDFGYVFDQVLDWTQYQMFKQAIIDSVDLLKNKRDYEAILQRVKEAVEIGNSRDNQLDTVLFSDEEIVPFEWLWEGRIPKGDITLIVGNPGV